MHQPAQILWRDKRVFISPAIGCPGRCQFCYLHGRSPSTDILGADLLWSRAVADPRFLSGRDGTVVSIGCLGDPLTPEACDSTIALLRLVAPSCNPIQLATRWVLADNQLAELAAALRASTATVYHSLTTLQHTQRLEPNTPPINRRIEFMTKLSVLGARAIIYAKPILPGITDAEAESLAELATSIGALAAVVGGLWAPRRVRVRLAGADIHLADADLLLDRNPLARRAGHQAVTTGAAGRVARAFRERGIPVERHSVPALRWALDEPVVAGAWSRS